MRLGVVVRVGVARRAALGAVERRLGLVRLGVVDRTVRGRARILLAAADDARDDATDDAEPEQRREHNDDDLVQLGLEEERAARSV